MSNVLPRIGVEAGGIDPQAILDLIDSLESPDIDVHSLMIVRKNAVVAEGWWKPFRSDSPHLLYSLTKSFCSTGAGFAVSEGLFGLDDLIVDHFQDQLPPTISENLSKVKVRHLLAMAVGHEKEPSVLPKENDWETVAKIFLAQPVVYEPGTHFVYNTPATHMISILIQKCSGQTLDQYLAPRLLRPLGIDGEYFTHGKNWTWGGSGLHATTEAVAKLGLLYLNGGRWEGAQLLPPGWAELATSSHVANGSDPDSDWSQGYGFQFWRSRHGFRGDGAFGQFCLVLPEYDSVIAITSGDSNMQAILDAVWSKLLPGFDRAGGSASALEDRLSHLAIAPRGSSVPGSSGSFANPEEAFRIDIGDGSVHLQLGWKVDLKIGEWTDFVFDFSRGTVPASGCAAWESSQTLVVRIVNSHTPASQTVRVTIGEGEASVEFFEKGEFEPVPSRKLIAKKVS